MIEEPLPGFCPQCGDILPPITNFGSIKCFKCPNKTYSANVYGEMASEYTIVFNTVSTHEESKSSDEGPVIDRRCPKCGNNKMSYATLQLRSADEGQTVFYTCTKCKFKETENS